MTKKDTLNAFENTEVASVGIKIAGNATGLSDAMKVDPVEYPKGARLKLLLDVKVAKIVFEDHDTKDEDDDRLRRVHQLHIETATFVDETVVADILQQHRDALKQLEGQQRAEFDDELEAGRDDEDLED